jgi:alpha/beta superfamily hydrolase
MKVLEIRNKQGELLEAIFEGATIQTAEKIILMVHGFGTNLHERGVFDDASKAILENFPNTTVVRFSVAGYGKSEGKQEEKSFDTMAEDIEVVFDYILKNKRSDGILNTISFSMGNHYFAKTVLKLKPEIDKLIVVNPAEYNFKERMQKVHWPDAKVDEDGVWYLDRADGSFTRVGPAFWKSLDTVAKERNLDSAVASYNSVLIRATEDHIADNAEMTKLPFKEIIEIHGDHNYSKPEDRKVFVDKLLGALKEDEI